jgi:acyl-coenzyme A synthetase/AMP-(fatty) acid ligase
MSTTADELAEVLRARRRRAPNAPYLHDAARSWSNAEFHAHCSSLAARLREEAGPASAIGTCAESSRLLPFLIWGTVLARIDLWLLPSFRSVAALAAYADKLPLGAIYTDIADVDSGERLRPLSSVLQAAPGSEPSSDDCLAKRPAFVFQTSGTEGAPKSVRCEHWTFARVSAAMQACGALDHARRARVFISQPLVHSYGLCTFLEYSSVDGEIVSGSDGSALGPVGDLMRAEIGGRVEAIEGVPYFWAQFAQFQHRLVLPALRHIGFGGGRIDAAVTRKLVAAYPRATISVRYGLTETPSVATHKVYSPPHGDEWPSSGRPIPAYRVEIRDGDVRVSDGDEREIVVLGECVAAPSGVLLTGDLGYFDSAGELIVRGRRSAFIKRRGYRLSPEQIESVACTCDGVVDCRAVCRDDRLILEVVAPAELSVLALLAKLRSSLPPAMVPDEVRRVEAVPRTYSGKVRRTLDE